MIPCPACGLRVPFLNGLLAAHAWHRGTWVDGPDDEDGNPTPGEWVGGCANRTIGQNGPPDSAVV